MNISEKHSGKAPIDFISVRIYEIRFFVKQCGRKGYGIIMMNNSCHANESIKCTVTQCTHHCQSKDYCSLGCITVGTHESNPTMDQCTDCLSFELKK